MRQLLPACDFKLDIRHLEIIAPKIEDSIENIARRHHADIRPFPAGNIRQTADQMAGTLHRDLDLREHALGFIRLISFEGHQFGIRQDRAEVVVYIVGHAVDATAHLRVAEESCKPLAHTAVGKDVGRIRHARPSFRTPLPAPMAQTDHRD